MFLEQERGTHANFYNLLYNVKVLLNRNMKLTAFRLRSTLNAQ